MPLFKYIQSNGLCNALFYKKYHLLSNIASPHLVPRPSSLVPLRKERVLTSSLFTRTSPKRASPRLVPRTSSLVPIRKERVLTSFLVPLNSSLSEKCESSPRPSPRRPLRKRRSLVKQYDVMATCRCNRIPLHHFYQPFEYRMAWLLTYL